jgi:hypothetical protein
MRLPFPAKMALPTPQSAFRTQDDATNSAIYCFGHDDATNSEIDFFTPR